MPERKKTIVYIDGFNLYYRALKGTPYKWLDLDAFCRKLLPKNDVIGISQDSPDAACRWSSLRPFGAACKRRSAVGAVEGQISAARTLGPEAAAALGPPSVLLVKFRHRASPLGSSQRAALPRHVAGTGGPRSRSILRRIAANSARGTATSASWKTT